MVKKLSILVLVIACLTLYVEGGHFKGKKITIDYNVSGTLNPDVTGNYILVGTYGSKSYYSLVGNGWYIWWHTTKEWWMISQVIGSINTPYWNRDDPNIVGEYIPWGAVGSATVSAGAQ